MVAMACNTTFTFKPSVHSDHGCDIVTGNVSVATLIQELCHSDHGCDIVTGNVSVATLIQELCQQMEDLAVHRFIAKMVIVFVLRFTTFRSVGFE